MTFPLSAWQCVAILVDSFIAGFGIAAGKWLFSKIGK
jgi:hypothetical protein